MRHAKKMTTEHLKIAGVLLSLIGTIILAVRVTRCFQPLRCPFRCMI
jgi:hypothetical protein